MKFSKIYGKLILGAVIFLIGSAAVHAQFLLQAPNAGDESNYKWYEASDTATVLGTDFFYEVTDPGIYFATYDGTLCGKNATGYFIVTNCNSPNNEVTLDITANVSPSATISWDPPLPGDQTMPMVIATQAVTKYTATITKVGNDMALPSFTVVCMDQSAILEDDVVSLDEDTSIIVPVYDNDSQIPTSGTLTATDPANGSVVIDINGTPNVPGDDLLTYVPDPNYNGPDSFDYTVCNSSGECSTATVTVTVIPVLDAIVDARSTEQNLPIDIYVLFNDNDLPIGGTISNTDTSNGTLVHNSNGTPVYAFDDYYTYTPNPDYLGSDSFDYTICDTMGHCSTATVTIIVVEPGVDLDADNDGIVDSFEDLNLDGDNDPSTDPTDSDGDGVPDYLDIDSDDDGIPDNVESQLTSLYILPSGVDDNENGLDDAYEVDAVGIFPVDTDNDDLPDYLDDDSDNDGVPDYIEGHDYDRDGQPDVVFIGSDKDNDGLDDGFEGSSTLDIDVNDEIDNPLLDLPNTDGDGESDYRDIDDDGDGTETTKEDANNDGNFQNDDADGNGTPDYLEPNYVEVLIYNVVTPNGDGVHDFLKIEGLDRYPNNTIHIYNRWGVLVYVTQAYNTQGNVFNGTSEGRVTVDQDNKLPVGTYFYVLEYEETEGNMKSMSGYIYLNK